MAQKIRVLGPKVYDPTLAKKILSCETDNGEKDGQTEEQPLEEGSDTVEDEASKNGAEDYSFFQHMQEVLAELAHERRRKDACLAKLKDVENELVDFQQSFGQKMRELRSSSC